jgi:hypothetical protein
MIAWSPSISCTPTGERGLDRRPYSVLGEKPGHGERVDQDVLVAFVVAAPGAILVPEEHGHLADERVWSRFRALGDDGVRRDHQVTRVDQVSSEESAPAAELDDQTIAFAHRLQNSRIPGAQSSAWKPNPRWWTSARSRR